MDPRTYCEHAINEIKGQAEYLPARVETHQKIVVLAYFAQQRPSERDFTVQLQLLAESAERSNRASLAAAARSVLSDWQATDSSPPPAARE